MRQADRVNWGIVGTGAIARTFAAALAHCETGHLAAVATRDGARPDLAPVFPGARIHQGYEALLADPDVDAVYLALPHPMHLAWGLRTVESGKHLLCEKPMTVNAYETMALIDAARKAGVFLMEAFMYRTHPQTQRLADLVADGVIGEVRMIQASYGFASPHPDTHRHRAAALGGGAVLDVGGYTASMARLIVGAARGQPFAEPHKVTASAHIGSTGVDEWTAATLAFDSGIVAQLSAAVSLALENAVHVYGTEGRISVAAPWFAGGRNGGRSTIVVTPRKGDVGTIEINEAKPLYAIEIDTAGRGILAGQKEALPPAMTLADTLGNMRVLDAWRSAIGLEYLFEKPVERALPFSGKPLKRLDEMRRARLPATKQQPSAIALGAMGMQNISHAGLIFDAFFERGGNFFDTAYTYRMGEADRLLGHWQHNRGVRDEIFILGKGAHTPLCYPDVIPRQIEESLARLQTDRFDAWLMHRDNPEIAIGEFIDVLDGEVRAGRIRAYGMSNWTMERLEQAIAYSAANGRRPPTILSNNFSLADMVAPVWPGCISSSTPPWRSWLAKHEMALVAWSSQARGFFTSRAGPDIHSDPQLVRCWYSGDNFARRQRATEWGRRHGFSANQVALAYCLNQDIAVVPIIGPLTPEELDDSLGALEIELTPDDLVWLETGESVAA